MQAMLLAAGFGTRLRPYTLVRPKPLFPVCNVPLLHILLDKLVALGCERIVVNCHYLPEQIKAAVAERPEVILQYETEVLGTGGGLRKALEHFQDGSDEPVLVINGDIFHDIDLSRLIKAHAASKDAVTMALHDYPRFNSVLIQQDRVRDFLSSKEVIGKIKEEGAEEQTLLAFTGIHLVNRAVLEAIPSGCFFHIIDLYRELAKAGKIGCTRIDGSFWQDMGTPDDYLDLHRHLLSSRTPFWQIHESAVIGNNVQFKDWGAVGPGAVIGDGAQLSRCVIWEGAKIVADAELADEIIVPAAT
ncbi:mannose-1-phosphate guanylyltransferase [Candidatus Electrothrix aarhusensis]|uniref:Mannose-1-phosphate guanylyltransferase n=1 Tax=Candidatus Electrothrix aarhusensis TaxID=1859131 RepID=A0A3S3QCW5_9BACT|nr:mannose-1-phosphate guanylyltransferase [Candidatus Electrothrix aarhusensis]